MRRSLIAPCLNHTIVQRLTNWLITSQGFSWALLAALIFKILLASLIPITGDEAYFIVWGRNPDLGFYDHPPMIGWWLSLQVLVGEGLVWIRTSAILVPLGIAYLSYLCTPSQSTRRQ